MAARQPSKVWSDKTLVVVGCAVLAGSFAFFTSENRSLIYTGAGLLAIGNGLMWPSLMAIISKVAGRDLQGAVQGFASSGGAIASIVGLLVGGLLFDVIGSRVFLLAATITALVFVLAWRIRPAA